MDVFGIIAIILALIGIAGGLLPVLPGPPLSWVALLLVSLSDKADDPVSVTTLIVWLIAAIIITVMDYILPGVVAKWTGGHRAAEVGAIIGLFAGIILTPVGMILGSFLGAFIGEYISERADMTQCLKAAAGAFLGFILSTGIKIIYSVIVLWQVLVHLF